MKAILMSIKPQHVANILNRLKTLEIRKRFPSDYVGWVYIYCTKKDSLGRIKDLPHDRYFVDCVETPEDFEKMDSGYDGKGKVVARFWCDKVEEHKDFGMFPYMGLRFNKATCLSGEDLEDYGFVEGKGYVPLYAIHITNLEIFDKPKEIKEFTPYCELCGSTSCCNCKHAQRDSELRFISCDKIKPLTHAPQSWQFIEV